MLSKQVENINKSQFYNFVHVFVHKFKLDIKKYCFKSVFNLYMVYAYYRDEYITEM